jgi:hypothetical protein
MVARPLENVVGKRFYMSSPFSVFLFDVIRPNQENVHVAVDAAIASCRRSEDRGVNWERFPRSELFLQALKKFGTEIGQLNYGFSSDMVPVEFVDPR